MTRDDEQRARETLIAELGATLDKSVAPESARAADRRTFEDPESLALLRALRADEAALTAELDQALAGPIPERLVEAVEQGFAARAGARGGGRAPWWALAAASLAFLVIGAGGALWWAESRIDQALLRFEARSELERSVLAETINRALETQVSGESLDWRSGGSMGRVTPLRTYRSRSGHWCREYSRTTRFNGEPIAVRALACRNEAGQWVTLRAKPTAAGNEL